MNRVEMHVEHVGLGPPAAVAVIRTPILAERPEVTERRPEHSDAKPLEYCLQRAEEQARVVVTERPAVRVRVRPASYFSCTTPRANGPRPRRLRVEMRAPGAHLEQASVDGGLLRDRRDSAVGHRPFAREVEVPSSRWLHPARRTSSAMVAALTSRQSTSSTSADRRTFWSIHRVQVTPTVMAQITDFVACSRPSTSTTVGLQDDHDPWPPSKTPNGSIPANSEAARGCGCSDLLREAPLPPHDWRCRLGQSERAPDARLDGHLGLFALAVPVGFEPICKPSSDPR